MKHKAMVNGTQCLALLFISRFFTMLVAVPDSRYTLEASSSLLILLLSTAAMFLLTIPLVTLMQRYPAQSLSDIAAAVCPTAKRGILVWQLLFCLFAAAGTASQSEYFVSTALYPKAERTLVLLLFLLVLWYLTELGLEALSRAALLVCALILFSFFLIFGGVFREIDWLHFTLPCYDAPEKLAVTALAYWGQNVELLPLCLLQPYKRKPNFRKDCACFLLGGLLITETISFFTAAVLGAYGKTRLYPVYTLAALSGHGFFSRLDYLHIINWTFACLLRGALFVQGAVLSWQELKPKEKGGKHTLPLLMVGGMALLLSHIDGGYHWTYTLFANGIPLFISVVLLPCLLLWKGRKQKRINAKTAKGGNR